VVLSLAMRCRAMLSNALPCDAMKTYDALHSIALPSLAQPCDAMKTYDV
jgi:hypothetical protein